MQVRVGTNKENDTVVIEMERPTGQVFDLLLTVEEARTVASALLVSADQCSRNSPLRLLVPGRIG